MKRKIKKGNQNDEKLSLKLYSNFFKKSSNVGNSQKSVYMCCEKKDVRTDAKHKIILRWPNEKHFHEKFLLAPTALINS